MKKILSSAAVILLISVFLNCFAVNIFASDVSAQAAILIEASSGDVIYAKNAHERLPMASTTKIMTAVVALENERLDKKIRISEKACGVEGSSIYLKPNEELTLEELLYALMLESANDAAAAIAIAVSGSIDAFAEEMNETAAKIGMNDSHFTNPHGLDDKDHYTTAADLAKLTAYAMQNDDFRRIVSTMKHTIPSSDGSVRVLINHNKLLRLSDDVVGVKTGFTKRSGRCLVSAAEADGVTVIAVTLNAPDDWNDHLNLHELGLSSYSSVTLAEPGEFQIEIPCATASDGTVTLVNRDSLSLCLKNGTEIRHTFKCDHILFPPIKEGEIYGSLKFIANDRVLAEIPLYAAENAELPQENKSVIDKLLDALG